MNLEHKLLRRRPSVARMFQHCGIALIPSKVSSTMLRPHAHDVHEAVLIRKGKLIHEIGGHKIESPSHTLDLVPHGITHRYRPSNSGVEIVNMLIDPQLHLNGKHIANDLFTHDARICQIDFSKFHESLWYHIDHILDEQRQQDFGWETSIPLHFQHILLLCERAIHQKHIHWIDQDDHRANNNRLNQLLQQIEQRPQLQWTLQRMATELGLSKEHVCRRFQQRVKCSPIDYVRQQRLSVAQDHLLQKKRSINDAARLSGFSSSLSCYRAFLKFTGLSPRDWLKQEIKLT